MNNCINNSELALFIGFLSLVGALCLAIVFVNLFFNFKQKRCKHDLLIKNCTVEAYSHAESEKVWLTYYRCEHCEKLIKKTTLAAAEEEAESLKEEA